ncbi:autophagy protein 5 [Diplodia corticola]|uniref:Autophagy protein 5 n=1 Tax=Diplodia corticola TaxID=236234 RepID=A0A1J9RY89_9PEZI|nr:autophagy protein 5 [Diplodia corticola]OJD32780.1 autophagy protein 5 [Diplodia corticola]
MASQRDLSTLQKQIWTGSIPLEIRLASTECRTYDDSDPYLIQVPRLSYIPFLLPRLHAFFAPSLINPDVHPSKGWLSCSDVPLKWHHPLGLLYDLYSGLEPYTPDSLHHSPSPPPSPPSPTSAAAATTTPDSTPLPWRLIVHFATPAPPTLVPLDPAYKAHHDAFVNAVKEADFLRNGSAKAAMSLSKEASDRLWDAVGRNDLAAWDAVHSKLLVSPPGAGPLRNVPMKLYLPGAPTAASGGGGGGNGGGASEDVAVATPTLATEGGGDAAAAATATTAESPAAGAPSPIASLRVVQALVSPTLSSGGGGGGGGGSGGSGASPRGQPQTMGTALNGIIPSLFPSRRSPLLAQPVLHGAVVPLSAPVEELLKAAAYADGFLHVAVVMMS